MTCNCRWWVKPSCHRLVVWHHTWKSTTQCQRYCQAHLLCLHTCCAMPAGKILFWRLDRDSKPPRRRFFPPLFDTGKLQNSVDGQTMRRSAVPKGDSTNQIQKRARDSSSCAKIRLRGIIAWWSRSKTARRPRAPRSEETRSQHHHHIKRRRPNKHNNTSISIEVHPTIFQQTLHYWFQAPKKDFI